MPDDIDKISEPASLRRGRPATLSRAARQDAIFDALEAVHADAGLEGATMQAIARYAGMSKRTLYCLFSSRTALLRAYMDRVSGQFIQPLSDNETDLPIAERLNRLLSGNARQEGYGLPLEILRAVMTQVPACPEMGRDLVDRLMRRDLEILTKELERGARRGEIEVEDIGRTAALLLDMVRPWPLESLLDPMRLATPQEFDARREFAIRVLLEGIGSFRTS
ncbi:TetR/AcrR family transcriptional regulator [uncultured Roseovarius sp.]|uniref:TetR/AcrR family transcriptional regulator n=1 Tax=uncultured Roseovarius sp. TaxID=293344 RepID=UPI0026037F0C|nr:TetR/AcrR family transcriptional regulator [uncultured Roseovarius sp.]